MTIRMIWTLAAQTDTEWWTRLTALEKRVAELEESSGILDSLTDASGGDLVTTAVGLGLVWLVTRLRAELKGQSGLPRPPGT